MVRQIDWSVEALSDLHEIKDYISRQSPANAESVIRAGEHAADRLIDFPFAHRTIPELDDPERRETFVDRGRLTYRVMPNRIGVVDIIHGARLFDKMQGRSFEEAQQQDYVAS